MQYSVELCLLGLAGALSLGAIATILRTRLMRLALDTPNARSLHSQVTPRMGGLGIILGWSVASLLYGLWRELPFAFWCVWGCVLGLSALCFVDDRRGLSAGLRFTVQLFVAGLVMAVLPWYLAVFWLVLAVFGLVWCMNLFNFMDGADGLVGGVGATGFAVLALQAMLAGQVELATLAALMSAALLGFLWFNWSPAKIFMGDCGSVPVGLLAGSLGLWGWQEGAWSGYVWVAAFSPLLLDATVTLLQRALRGERVWQAHRTHYYQRAVQLGWSHRLVAGVYIGFAVAMSAGLFIWSQAWCIGLVVAVCFARFIDRRWVARVVSD